MQFLLIDASKYVYVETSDVVRFLTLQMSQQIVVELWDQIRENETVADNDAKYHSTTSWSLEIDPVQVSLTQIVTNVRCWPSRLGCRSRVDRSFRSVIDFVILTGVPLD